LINLVWMLLIALGIGVGSVRGSPEELTEALMTSAQLGVETVLGLIGVMVLWLGMMKIAEDSGLVARLAGLMRPILSRLFPSLPRDHPALGAITLSVSANLLGAGQAATPLGLKAMEEMKSVVPDTQEASDAMCTFLALNTSGLTLIPTTVIALRTQAGSAAPTEIVGATLLATACSTVCAVTLDYFFRRRRRRR